MRPPPLALRACLPAGVAALAVGARFATGIAVLGSSAGARLATLGAALLGVSAPARFALLGLATEAVAPAAYARHTSSALATVLASARPAAPASASSSPEPS